MLIVKDVNNVKLMSAYCSALAVETQNGDEDITLTREFDVPVSEEIKTLEFKCMRDLVKHIEETSWLEIRMVDHIKLEGVSFTSIGYNIHKSGEEVEFGRVSVIGHLRANIGRIFEKNVFDAMIASTEKYAELKSNNYTVNQKLLRKMPEKDGTRKRALEFVNSMVNIKDNHIVYATIHDMGESIHVKVATREMGKSNSVNVKKEIVKYSDLTDGVLYKLIERVNSFDGFEPKAITIFVFESTILFVNLTV